MVCVEKTASSLDVFELERRHIKQHNHNISLCIKPAILYFCVQLHEFLFSALTTRTISPLSCVFASFFMTRAAAYLPTSFSSFLVQVFFSRLLQLSSNNRSCFPIPFHRFSQRSTSARVSAWPHKNDMDYRWMEEKGRIERNIPTQKKRRLAMHSEVARWWWLEIHVWASFSSLHF